MILKIIRYTLLSALTLLGIFFVYRGNIGDDKMKKVNAIILNIQYVRSRESRGGYAYSLALTTNALNYKIAVAFESFNDAKNDTLGNTLREGETYTFYINPTFPVTNGQDNGISRIYYKGVLIYKHDEDLGEVVGGFMTFIGIVGIAINSIKPKSQSA